MSVTSTERTEPTSPETAAGSPPPEWSSEPRTSRRKTLLIALAVVAIALAAGAVTLALTSSSGPAAKATSGQVTGGTISGPFGADMQAQQQAQQRKQQFATGVMTLMEDHLALGAGSTPRSRLTSRATRWRTSTRRPRRRSTIRSNLRPSRTHSRRGRSTRMAGARTVAVRSDEVPER